MVAHSEESTFKAESEFRRSLEAALRTGLAAAASIAWAEVGPIRNPLNFFSPVVAIVVTLDTAGGTIAASLGCLHGALSGAFFAFLIRLIADQNCWVAGLLMFIGFFLIVRRRRLNSLGRKIACVTLIVAVLTFEREDVTAWIMSMLSWYKSVFEGGVWATLALMVPYPRLALREGALRAQYTCKLMQRAMVSCVEGFKMGRRVLTDMDLLIEQMRLNLACLDPLDDMLVTRIDLLIEQMRLNLARLDALCVPCELEQVLLLWGQAGGDSPAKGLQIIVKNMRARVECIEGMQRALSLQRSDVEQMAFALSLLRSDVEQMAFVAYLRPYLNATQCATMECATVEAGERRHSSSIAQVLDFSSDLTTQRKVLDFMADLTAPRSRVLDFMADLTAPRSLVLGRALEARQHDLPAAIAENMQVTAALLDAYQTARLHLLYGIDGGGGGDGGDGGGGRRHGTRTGPASPQSPAPPHALSAESAEEGVGNTDSVVNWRDLQTPEFNPKVHMAVVVSWRDLQTPEFNPEVHMELVRQWQQHGFRFAFARGAFVFSLVTLATMLARLSEAQAEIQRGHRLPRLRRVRIAARQAARMLYESVTPLPALIAAARMLYESVARMLYESPGSACGSAVVKYDTRQRLRQRHGPGSAALVLERTEDYFRRHHRDIVHPLKVALILTICALFVLVGYLSDKVAAGAWVGVTAGFIVSEDSSSAAVTSNLRLIGSVVGAMYGWFLTELVNNDAARKLAAIGLPPWVAFCAFFKNSKSHGYAAIVSAFTAVIIVLGTFNASAVGSVAPLTRIQNTILGLVIYMANTILGLVIYMAVDNLVFPVRAKVLLRGELAEALGLMRDAVNCLDAQLLGQVAGAVTAQLPPPPPQQQKSPAAVAAADAATADDSGSNGRSRSSSCSGDLEPAADRSMRTAAAAEDAANTASAQVSAAVRKATTPMTAAAAAALRSAVPAAAAVVVERLAAARSDASAAATSNSEDGSGGSSSGGSTVAMVRRLTLVEDERVAAVVLPPVELTHLNAVHRSVGEQARYINLASLEPTLWHHPFHSPSYYALHKAEQNVLAVLIQLKRSSHSFSTMCTAKTWAVETLLRLIGCLCDVKKVSLVMAHAQTLLRLIGSALGDAQSVFGAHHRVCERRERRLQQAQHVLEVQAEARLLKECIYSEIVQAQHVLEVHAEARSLKQCIYSEIVVQADARLLKECIYSEIASYMVNIQGGAPQTSLQFALRFNTTVFSLMQLQHALVELGHAVMALLERERQIFYYT
ncbi:hypothetical protein JKP88DRAFT_285137 [Tribonema minus]|uniref:Integral membrane bound transporter domain-containing protein n=1 Tax=Tribonema minus TaxID=303371 RepID=A0A836CQ15_9STRA|nr:hypothetical protein JKP88DRAFT_285137 [Tribonema minus]